MYELVGNKWQKVETSQILTSYAGANFIIHNRNVCDILSRVWLQFRFGPLCGHPSSFRLWIVVVTLIGVVMWWRGTVTYRKPQATVRVC